jgi:hypothetical protein
MSGDARPTSGRRRPEVPFARSASSFVDFLHTCVLARVLAADHNPPLCALDALGWKPWAKRAKPLCGWI